MKRIFLILALAVFLVPFVFAGGQKESKELTVYTPASTEIVNLVVPRFEKQYGVKVNTVEAGTGQLFNRIKAESANPQADIMFTGGIDSGGAFRAYLDDYVSKEDSNLIISAKDHPWYNAVFLHPMGIIYNKNLVKAGVVKGWKDLTDPKWKGKVLMADPRKSGSAYGELIIMLEDYGRGEAAWNLVKALYKNLVIVSSSSHTYKFVASGQYPFGFTHERNAYKYAAAGKPVGFIYPEEGTAVRPDGIYLVKGGPNPKLAKKFIDFVLSKEIMTALRDLGFRVNRKDVAPPKGYPPISSIKQGPYDPVWAATHRAEILKKWTAIAEAEAK